MDYIQGGNKDVVIDTTNGDINLYVISPGTKAIDFSGSGGLEHIRNGSGITDCRTQGEAYQNAFSIFGTPTDVETPVGLETPPDTESTQQFTLKGGTTTTGLFVWAPYTEINLKGGGNGDPNFCGKIWGNDFNANGDVTLTTPPSQGGDGSGSPTDNLFVDWVARSARSFGLFNK